ncbi:glutathione S-transferase family protein [Pseudorhodoferax sp.]|uniref:glutathione S-transferase family protein n=1 Tax=Pseudorhodoferax sp. TaxID=1993553 RepID=UPI002DD6521C|nr:glutathione S-transferase family protein [Pseudorhodoferax sp.]
MLRLHYYPSNASFAPQVLLRELDLPFEPVLVDRTQQAHKSPAYLKLNPNGLIPVLEDGALVLYETLAICLHLVDKRPAAGLAPAVGTAERARFYKWMAWLSNTLQPALIRYFYPERLVDEGNADGAAQVRRHAQAAVVTQLQQLDDQLAAVATQGPWLLGERYSAADPYAFMLCRWTRGFDRQPARDFVHIGPWLQRVLARPAVQQTVAFEKLPLPLV